MSKDWSTLDTEKLLRTRQDQHEQTTSAGVGGYAVPLGEPIRPATPEPAQKPKSKKKQKKQEK
jgi:hypothetical protein